MTTTIKVKAIHHYPNSVSYGSFYTYSLPLDQTSKPVLNPFFIYSQEKKQYPYSRNYLYIEIHNKNKINHTDYIQAFINYLNKHYRNKLLEMNDIETIESALDISFNEKNLDAERMTPF